MQLLTECPVSGKSEFPSVKQLSAPATLSVFAFSGVNVVHFSQGELVDIYSEGLNRATSPEVKIPTGLHICVSYSSSCPFQCTAHSKAPKTLLLNMEGLLLGFVWNSHKCLN